MGKYAHALRLPIMRRPDPRRHEYRASPPFFLSPAWGTHSLPGAYAAGRTSPRSGPEGRTPDAAPVTILHSDGPGLQGVESGIFTYGVHAKRKDAHEAAYKRSGFTHAAVGTAKGHGGEFDSPMRQLGPLRALEKAGKLPIERWRNR